MPIKNLKYKKNEMSDSLSTKCKHLPSVMVGSVACVECEFCVSRDVESQYVICTAGKGSREVSNAD